jgi:hypothetical protein
VLALAFDKDFASLTVVCAGATEVIVTAAGAAEPAAAAGRFAAGLGAFLLALSLGKGLALLALACIGTTAVVTATGAAEPPTLRREGRADEGSEGGGAATTFSGSEKATGFAVGSSEMLDILPFVFVSFGRVASALEALVGGETLVVEGVVEFLVWEALAFEGVVEFLVWEALAFEGVVEFLVLEEALAFEGVLAEFLLFADDVRGAVADTAAFSTGTSTASTAGLLRELLAGTDTVVGGSEGSTIDKTLARRLPVLEAAEAGTSTAADEFALCFEEARLGDADEAAAAEATMGLVLLADTGCLRLLPFASACTGSASFFSSSSMPSASTLARVSCDNNIQYWPY